MAWTATIVSTGIDSAGVAVVVDFTSDAVPTLPTQREVCHFKTETPDQVNAAINDRLTALNAQDAILAGISTGPFTPPVPTDLTQDQLNQQAYQDALGVLIQVNNAISAGAYDGQNDPDGVLASAKANAQAAWGLVSAALQAEISTAQSSISTQTNNMKKGGQVTG